MLAPEDLPATHARVMRVVDPSKAATPKSASKSARPKAPPSPTISKKVEDEKSSRFVEDFTSSDESSGAGVEDDGWNVVAAKPKSWFHMPTIPRDEADPQNPSHYPSLKAWHPPLLRQLYPCQQRYKRRTPKRRKRRKRPKRPKKPTANGD